MSLGKPIPTFSIYEAQRQLGKGACLIDIRDDASYVKLHVPDSHSVPRLDPQKMKRVLDGVQPERMVLLMCYHGISSRAAAQQVARLGYRAASVDGGFSAWQAASLPVASKAHGRASWFERYDRQICLPSIGVAGQQKLQDSHVLLIGAGGLGSPAALYLAASGVGHLSIVDDDVVERSNLQRQVLHGEADIDGLKIHSAETRLGQLNPECKVSTYAMRFEDSTAAMLLPDVDIVIDGSDNISTRMAVNRACVLHRKPWVYAAVEAFKGQVALFEAGVDDSKPCYACLFGDDPSQVRAQSCSDLGVLGVMPGIMGNLQALEALKYLLQLVPADSVSHMHTFDGLNMSLRSMRMHKELDCPVCVHR